MRNQRKRAAAHKIWSSQAQLLGFKTRFYKSQQQQMGLHHCQGRVAGTAACEQGRRGTAHRCGTRCAGAGANRWLWGFTAHARLCIPPALWTDPVPHISASPGWCALQGFGPVTANKSETSTLQSTCQISHSASGEWKEKPFHKSFQF